MSIHVHRHDHVDVRGSLMVVDHPSNTQLSTMHVMRSEHPCSRDQLRYQRLRRDLICEGTQCGWCMYTTTARVWIPLVLVSIRQVAQETRYEFRLSLPVKKQLGCRLLDRPQGRKITIFGNGHHWMGEYRAERINLHHAEFERCKVSDDLVRLAHLLCIDHLAHMRDAPVL
jgi:hypothetical protein